MLDLIQKREAAFFELGYAMGQNMKVRFETIF
jgi:hypothetical protein